MLSTDRTVQSQSGNGHTTLGGLRPLESRSQKPPTTYASSCVCRAGQSKASQRLRRPGQQHRPTQSAKKHTQKIAQGRQPPLRDAREPKVPNKWPPMDEALHLSQNGYGHIHVYIYIYMCNCICKYKHIHIYYIYMHIYMYI